MYGCKGWTKKKANHQKIDVFELWCWRRLVRVPWTSRRSKPSIQREISPEFIGKTHAEAEVPILLPPDAKNGLIKKDPHAREDCMQEEGTTEGEMVRKHH